MRRFAAIPRSTRALLLVAAVLASIVALQWAFPPKPARIELTATDIQLQELPEFNASAYQSPAFEEFGDMLERPLFYSDRTLPEIPQPQVAQAAPPAPLQLKLEGIAISAESRVAVLRDLSNNQLLQLAEGMHHDGWTLEAVASTGARFSRGQQVSELILDPSAQLRRR